MRIISGSYKGRKLTSGKDQRIRPTTNKVKEFIFNVLDDFPLNKSVVDFFSGSGNLGLEALSRGAKTVVFVENASSSISVLKRNIRALNISKDQYTIVHSDAIKYVTRSPHPFDLIFMDPPFVYPPLQNLVDKTTRSAFMHEKSLLVIEHETINPIDMESPLYVIIKQKKMGRSLISFIMKRERYE